MVEINYWAVIVAAIVGMAVGAFWYGPLFGKPWAKMMGFSKDKWVSAEFKPNDMPKMMLIQLIGSLVMAYVLAHLIAFSSAYMKLSGVMAGLQAGFWNWLGIMAPFSLSIVLWEGKPWKLWILNNAYYLVALSLMGIIISTWI